VPLVMEVMDSLRRAATADTRARRGRRHHPPEMLKRCARPAWRASPPKSFDITAIMRDM
jgi:hypothetical protein